MAFERRFGVGYEVDEPLLFIDATYSMRVIVARDHPIALCERPRELAVPVIQVKVLEAAAVRCPDELMAVSEEGQVVIQVNPLVAVLAQQLPGGSRSRIGAQQGECFLIPGLPLDRKSIAVRKPIHAGQINISVGAEVNASAWGRRGRGTWRSTRGCGYCG